MCVFAQEQQFENNQQHPLGWGESLMGRADPLDPMYRKTLFLTELRARNGLWIRLRLSIPSGFCTYYSIIILYIVFGER